VNHTKLCLCGCGKQVHGNSKFISRHNLKLTKNKTWEELYGKEKAKQMKKNLAEQTRIKFSKPKSEKHKQKISEYNQKYRAGKSWEEIYGKEKAKLMKEKYLKNKPKQLKGYTLEEKYGKEKSIELKRKNSEGKKGKTYEEIHGKEKAKKMKAKRSKPRKWTKEKIINAYLDIIQKYGKVQRSDVYNKFFKEGKICDLYTIKKQLGSLDQLVKITGVNFIRHDRLSRIGKNETFILDNIEKEKGIKLERQFFVDGNFVDGYDKENNVVYEVDEAHHTYRQVEDAIREYIIKQEIGCKFVRINESDFLNKSIKQKMVGDF